MSDAQMAFRLGYLPHYLLLFKELYGAPLLRRLGYEVGDSVLLILEQLAAAVTALAAEVPSHVYAHLHQSLQREHAHWTAVCAADDDGRPATGSIVPPGAIADPGAAEGVSFLGAPALIPLTAAAVPAASRYRPWFDLGRALGEYLTTLNALEDGAALPPLECVVDAVHRLPGHVTDRLPLLTAIVARTPDLPRLGHATTWPPCGVKPVAVPGSRVCPLPSMPSSCVKTWRRWPPPSRRHWRRGPSQASAPPPRLLRFHR